MSTMTNLHYIFFNFFPESAVVVALAVRALPSILLLTRINVLCTISKNSTTLASMKCPWMWPTSSKKKEKKFFREIDFTKNRPIDPSLICLYKLKKITQPIYYYYYNLSKIFAAASQRWLWRFLFSRKKELLLNWKIMCLPMPWAWNEILTVASNFVVYD